MCLCQKQMSTFSWVYVCELPMCSIDVSNSTKLHSCGIEEAYSSHFIHFQNCLSILLPLPFHIKFRIILSIHFQNCYSISFSKSFIYSSAFTFPYKFENNFVYSYKKNLGRIFMVIVLNPCINLRRAHTFTMLGLPILYLS